MAIILVEIFVVIRQSLSDSLYSNIQPVQTKVKVRE